MKTSAKKPDVVNRPNHYQCEAGFQVVDVIEQFRIPGHMDQAVIYILRHEKKGGEEDVRKAIWWLIRWFRHFCKIRITVDAEGNVNAEPIGRNG